MKIELIEDLDALYPLFHGWWTGHGWSAVPQSILPKLGVLVRGKSDEPLAAGWLYMDNSSPVSMLEWLVTDPQAKPAATVVALHHLVTFLKQHARSLGYGAMLTTCRQQSLARFLECRGFEETDRGMIHLLSVLPP